MENKVILLLLFLFILSIANSIKLKNNQQKHKFYSIDEENIKDQEEIFGGDKWSSSSSPQPSQNSTIRVFPYPHYIYAGNETYYLNVNFTMSTKSKSAILLKAIDRYQKHIFQEEPLTKKSPPLMELLITVDSDNETLQFGVDESYTLTIEMGSANLHASTIYGVMRGLESFSQLVQFDYNYSVYKVKNAPVYINDKPRFPHRGLLLDTSRHFIPVDAIKKFIDSLSYAKFNVFHWHIIDSQSFPLQILSYPKLWQGSWSRMEVYTQSDVKEVVQFAKERGIRVIVEIDIPGHSYSWTVGYPEILPTKYYKSPLCNQTCPTECNVPIDPSKELSYNISYSILNELTGGKQGSGLFPDNYIHIGGDEVVVDCWKNSRSIREWMVLHGLWNFNKVTKYFEKKVHDKVFEYERNPIVWEDTYLLFGKDLPKSVTVQVYHQLSTLRAAIADGHNAIASNAWNWYLDLNNSWETMYLNNITVNITDPVQLSRVLGGEACMWGEMMDISDLFSKVWPRAAAVAERLWSPDEICNVETVVPRLERFRCHIMFRGIDSAPLNDTTPLNPSPIDPGSCYDE